MSATNNYFNHDKCKNTITISSITFSEYLQ